MAAQHSLSEEPAWRPPPSAAHPVSGRFLWGLLLLPALLLLVPFFASVAMLIRYSFNSWSADTGMVQDFALGNYAVMLGDPYYLGVLLNTLKLGGITTVVALVMGYPVAYAVAQARQKHILLLLVVVPLWMDVLIRAFGWIVILNRQGLINNALMGLSLVEEPLTIVGTPVAVVLDLLHETLPFMIVTLFSILQRQDPTLRDAAMGLGAGRLVTFWEVTLPLSLPGMVASTTLTFSLAVSAFAGPLILGAGKVPMMSLLIFQQMTFGMNWALGSAEAVTLMTIVLGMLIGYAFLIRRLPAER